jgi:hypothetical protein
MDTDKKLSSWGQAGKERLENLPPEVKAAGARKGGIKSQRKQKTRRAAKDVLIDLLMSDSTDKPIADTVISKNIEPTEQATLLYNMMKRASKSANMAELVFRLTGDLEQAPQQNITIVNQLSDEQLQAQINQLRGNDGMIDITPEPPKLE